FRACAGFSDVKLSCSAILDPHQVANLPQHACEHRGLVVLDGLADLAQAEGAERAAVLLRLPDPALHLGDAHLGHSSAPSTAGVSVASSGALSGSTWEIE